jgi:hypothetical protein
MHPTDHLTALAMSKSLPSLLINIDRIVQTFPDRKVSEKSKNLPLDPFNPSGSARTILPLSILEPLNQPLSIFSHPFNIFINVSQCKALKSSPLSHPRSTEALPHSPSFPRLPSFRPPIRSLTLPPILTPALNRTADP